MKQRTWMGGVGVALVAVVLGVAGCEDSGGGGNEGATPSQSTATGILPSSGAYAFHCRLQGFHSLSIRFRVQPDRGAILFSMDGYAFYSIPVADGRFYYFNGLWWDTPSDSGKAYPTDGFAVSGHFVAADRAEGTISYKGTSFPGTDASFFDLAPFTAQR